jgi:hypothetical protein
VCERFAVDILLKANETARTMSRTMLGTKRPEVQEQWTNNLSGDAMDRLLVGIQVLAAAIALSIVGQWLFA